jgi:uncharacterized protein (TIGR02996 family)
MILTSPAAIGLFRAIVEDPTDDMPRLLLADVLEEAGDPRGEFIRVQCELAKHPCARLEEGVVHTIAPFCYGCHEVAALRRRERELLDEYGFDWFGQFTRTACVDEGRGPDRNAWNFRSLGGTLGGCHFRRGFVVSVTLTCADWWGVVCPVCSGWRSREAYCNHCHGTGRTGEHGPALVLAAPIEEVVLSDREPEFYQDWGGQGYLWHRSVGNARSDVPPCLYDRMDETVVLGRADALATLSHAALAWARHEAGLPALA